MYMLFFFFVEIYMFEIIFAGVSELLLHPLPHGRIAILSFLNGNPTTKENLRNNNDVSYHFLRRRLFHPLVWCYVDNFTHFLFGASFSLFCSVEILSLLLKLISIFRFEIESNRPSKDLNNSFWVYLKGVLQNGCNWLN